MDDEAGHFPFGIRYETGLLGCRRHSRAEREWTEAVQTAPSAEIIVANLGMLKTNLKQYKQAISYLQLAVRLNPDDAEARHNLAVCYREWGGAIYKAITVEEGIAFKVRSWHNFDRRANS